MLPDKTKRCYRAQDADVLDRDALIEAGAKALAGRSTLQDPEPWRRPELRDRAEAVLRAVGLIA